MTFIDTHTHLDDGAFEADLERVIQASRDAGVSRWINVGYNENRWRSSRTIANRFDGMHVMLGLHPGNADDWSPRLEEDLRRAVEEHPPVAIGEIGIDLYWRKDNLERQEHAFRAQLAIARETGLPAVIHMRDADEPLLRVLSDTAELPHVHFHSFDGGDALRQWVEGHGATMGVGGLITRRGSESLQEWVAGISRHAVVLETDSPYLKPRGIRGKRNEPAFLPEVARLLANLWDVDVEKVAEHTTANAERIFGLAEEPS